ncbi:AbrB/MazE/SpoVT family DNA-binding domain-containing protein [Wenzhouxiangella sp. EGI_FJ10409]
METVRVSSKYQVEIPKAVRRKLNLKPVPRGAPRFRGGLKSR